ncbi:MAG: response regulator [Magnetococcales bacterium]|nr:response regulator [Magnetococcales bacterium]
MTDHNARPLVLIVDDQPDNVMRLAEALKQEEYLLRFALDGQEALRMVAAMEVDLILLDVVMPEMDGHTVCRLLKADPRTRDIPILFVTAKRGVEDETLALELGAVDFISKPFTASVVRARVRTQMNMLRARARLVEAEKQTALGQLVTGVAHEINTPAGIGITSASELEERTRRFATLVRGDGISEDELWEYLASTERLARLIHDSLERVSDLVCRFKSLAVGQPGESARAFAIRACLKSAVSLLCHDPDRARLSVTIACPASVSMHGYPGVLSRIVIHLLHYSRTHSFRPDQVGAVLIEVTEAGERIDITYRDDGPGMPEDACRCIFDPFHTLWLDHGRYGFGMHIVFNLVTRVLGGTITCDSTPGNGVLFRIQLPRRGPAVADAS